MTASSVTQNSLQIEFHNKNNPSDSSLKEKIRHATPLAEILKSLYEKQKGNLEIQANFISFEVSIIQDHNISELLQYIFKTLEIHQWKRNKIIMLSFWNCFCISGTGLRNFGSGIHHRLPNLVSLTINFTGCTNFNNQSLINLGLQIGRNLSKLEKLSLDFSRCHQIKDKGLRLFGSEVFNYLLSLKSLKLNFYGCKLISDEGIKAFGSKVCHLSNFKQLALAFSVCDNTTDKSLHFIGHRIFRHLTGLENLFLNFWGCYQITDDGFKDLIACIAKQLVQLQKLSLNFKECHQITGEGLKISGSKICHSLKKLTSVSLDFDRCFQVKNADLEGIIADFKANLALLNQLTINSVKEL